MIPMALFVVCGSSSTKTSFSTLYQHTRPVLTFIKYFGIEIANLSFMQLNRMMHKI
jgi:hypothetical protein